MKLSTIVLGISIAVVSLFATPRQAEAAAVSCTVTGVAYDDGPRLIVNCSGTYYYGQSATGCQSKSVDTLKVWNSMAQAALLSGKKLQVETQTATGCTGYIGLIWLNN